MKICFFGTYDRSYTSNKLTIQGFLENGCEVVEVNAEIKITSLDKKSEMGWLPLMKRVVRKYRIITETIKHWKDIQTSDVIYVGYPGHFDVLPAWVVAKILGKKLVFNPLLIFYTGFVEEQGILKSDSILARVTKFGETLIYNLCDLVIADTPHQKEFMESIFLVPKRKLRVVAIGADDRFYEYTPYKQTKKFVVTYYGLYSPIHGVEHIIEAARLLRDRSDIVFEFIGQGNTLEKTMAAVKKYKMTNVEFFHHIPQEEHVPLMKRANIFMGFMAKHPSVDRIIPNKVYQGLSLGKVVVTADAPVIRGVFTHKKNMYLVPPANPKALAEAITDSADHAARSTQIAEEGHRKFTNEFSPKAVGGAIIKAIGEIRRA